MANKLVESYIHGYDNLPSSRISPGNRLVGSTFLGLTQSDAHLVRDALPQGNNVDTDSPMPRGCLPALAGGIVLLGSFLIHRLRT